MALSTFVKINNVSSLSDARYCAGMGVNILGFSVVEKSSSYIDPKKFKEITQWVSGPRMAGEFESATVDEIKLATTTYELDFIETINADHLEALASLNIPLILKLTLKYPRDMDQVENIISYAGDLIDFIHLTLDSSLYSQFEKQIISLQKPVILSLSDPMGQLSKLSQQIKGISLTANEEDQTGLQDYGEIMDVLEALEIED